MLIHDIVPPKNKKQNLPAQKLRRMNRKAKNKFLPVLLVALIIFQTITGIFLPMEISPNSPYLEIQETYAAGWYNTGGTWGYRREITIDYTKVDMDLTDFAVLISVIDADLADTDNSGHVVQSDGGDILFTNSDGDKLDHEIEKYTNTTGELIVWVEVDSLSSSVDTVLYIYYGSSVAGDQWDMNATWESSLKMVQHLQEEVIDEGTVTDAHLDSTANDNHGDQHGNDDAATQIYKGQDFDGTDDYVSIADDSSLNITDAITIEAWVKKTATDYGTPTGTAITTCVELQAMKDNLSGDYYLANDIDCSDTSGWNSDGAGGFYGFEPVGFNYNNSFTGNFDGQGYVITGLYINRPSTWFIGLFGYVRAGDEFKNVGLENVNVTGGNNVGGLAGYCRDGRSITSSYSTGNVTGDSTVGGLIGFSNDEGGVITNCYSTSNVDSSQGCAGGLVGGVEGPITNSYATGNVTGGNNVGGLAGYCWGGPESITNSYATGSVTGSEIVGGLVGVNYATVTDSYSTGSVTGDLSVGGLIGLNEGTITNCYSTGYVDTGASITVGGLIGSSSGTVISSYWDTETSGQATSVGGTGKTTAEMKQQATFSGWDFTDIWGIEEYVTYPFEQWQWGYLISKGRDAYSLQMNREGSILYGYVNNNEITTSVSTPTNWHHYIVTFDGTSQKLYVDGALKNTTSPGGAIGTNSNNLTIGDGFEAYFNGAIDEVKIYNRALIANEISTQYNNQNNPSVFCSMGSQEANTVPNIPTLISPSSDSYTLRKTQTTVSA